MLLTQTNWLRMPAREPGSSIDAPNGAHIGTMLLKRHKTLPHPREERFLDTVPAVSTLQTRDTSLDMGISSLPSSDTSSPHTLKHASRRIGAPGLPPTPPTHSRQSSGSHPTIPVVPKFDITSINSADLSSLPSTPPNQRSPPTPDVTPPRSMPLAFRPPASDRYPSSRTDSFKTARENPYSSDEDEVSTVRPNLHSARTSAVQVPQVQQKPQPQKEIGLGLSLDLEDNEGSVTPRPRVDPSEEEFVVFDGEWGSSAGSTEEVSEVERVWDDNLMRNVVVRKGPVRKLPKLHMSNDRPVKVLEDDIVSPTMATKVVRSMPLQERIARHRMARDLSDKITKEKAAEHAWLSGTESESPTTSDVRRFSTMSGRSVTSTVIEAMVVDGPPTRRKTLRHSRKQLGLRSLGSDQSTIYSTYSTTQSTTSTAPNSVTSNGTQRRLHHSAAKLPERRHQSLASTGTVSTTTSTSSKSRREIIRSGAIPVVVIPDRRSSTKSSRAPSLRSTSSRRTRRSNSLNSAPLSQSSKFNEPGYFDKVPTRKRTMSESAGSGHSVRTIDFPPVVPTRRSSLSAPTSRNVSRAGSLTAESLKAHNMLQAKKQEAVKPELAKSQQSPELDRHPASHSAHSGRPNFDLNGDPFFGNRLSTQATPFSQASYETAGTTAEVSEALAVSLYPHQNTSVLVIQHKVPSEPSPPTLPTLDTSQSLVPHMEVNGYSTTGAVTPPQTSHPMDAVDSPLRNPRVPPEPPAIKFIPPTPAGNEEDRQLGYELEEVPAAVDNKPKRSVSLMRRAFSTRQPSEHLAQQPGFLKRAFSLSGHRKDLLDQSTQTSKAEANPMTMYPSVVDRPADGSKLHPFWRPAHFWDDLEDHDEYYDDDGPESRPRQPKRTLSEKLKRTFAILPIQDEYNPEDYSVDRRTMHRTPSGNLRVVKQSSSSSLQRGAGNRREYSEVRPVSGPSEGSFGYGFREGNGGRVHTIPGLGLRVEYVGWSGMKRRMSEKRREQRSEKLRATISGPKGVKSGIDDVLRRRSQG